MNNVTSTLLEVIYIQNHPDRRASGMDAKGLLQWAVRMGLISQQEADTAMKEQQ